LSIREIVAAQEMQALNRRTLIRLVRGVVVYAFLVGLSAITIGPFVMMLSVALTPGLNFMSYPMRLIPANPGLDNFIALFESTKILRWIFNSVFVSVSIVISHLFTCSLAGYAFARGSFPGRDVVFWLFMGTLMVLLRLDRAPVYLHFRHVSVAPVLQHYISGIR